MRFNSVVITAVLFALPALAMQTPLVEIARVDVKGSDKYIITLKQGVDKYLFLNKKRIAITDDWSVINGFAGFFTKEEVDKLSTDDQVATISEDGIVHSDAITTQTDAPWGLSRLSTIERLVNQNVSATDFKYTYDDTAGEGVDIYVLDTGVYVEHNEFGGRARWGKTFGGYQDADNRGHGTHCAGTAAGKRYGVAKAANIIAVKVLGDDGKGTGSGLISGINWVWMEAWTSGRPAIASMSLGMNSPSSAVDEAVQRLSLAGIHAVVSAGNSNVDASDRSPSRVSTAITVGATSIDDVRDWYSNYGSVVNIFAPGGNIISAGITSPDAWRFASGTSMAVPHISGLIANLIVLEGNLSPADMANKLRDLSLKFYIGNIPLGTPNLLAQNGLASK